MTAAHCYDSSTTSIDVVLNATNIQTLSGYEVVTDVPTVLVHPSYDPNNQEVSRPFGRCPATSPDPLKRSQERISAQLPLVLTFCSFRPLYGQSRMISC